MRVYTYLAATRKGAAPLRCYGCPVTVQIGDTQTQLVYQFHLPHCACAVVHWQSGQIVAVILPEDLPGTFEQQAQNAVDRKTKNRGVDEKRFFEVINGAPKLNTLLERL